MVRSLYSGVSGLKSHQTRMDVIGNNIANVNTYGFKASRVCFSDIYYQYQRTETGGRANFAGNNPSQVGYGTQVASIDKNMAPSNLQNTGKTFDCGIADEGFFVCATLDRNRQVNGVSFTRMGNFTLDSVGNLVNANNEFILGTVNTGRLQRGTFSSSEMIDKVPAANANELDVININDLVWDAFMPQCQIEFDDVSSKYCKPSAARHFPGGDVPVVTIFTGVNPYDSDEQIAYDYHMATADPGDAAATPPYGASEINPANIVAGRRVEGTNVFGSTPEDPGNRIFDSDNSLLNNTTEIEAIIAANKTGSTYNAENTPIIVKSDYILYSVNGRFVNRQGVEYDPKEGLYLDEDGNYYEYTCRTYVNEDGTLRKTYSYERMKLNETTQVYEPENPAVSYTYDDVSDTYQRQDAFGNIVYADMTDKSLKYADLDGFTIGSDGIMTADYAGTLYSIARFELAAFDNAEGLKQIGDTEFAQTRASGVAVIKSPGTSGVGTVESGKLEMSNVNLADEFSDMIVTQRGYQANARIITTSDSMLEELVNLKR